MTADADHVAPPDPGPASLADVIDLGEARWDDDAIPPRRWRRPWPALLAWLVVAVAVLGLGGSAPGPWRLGPPLWTLPGSPALILADGALFTADGGGVMTERDPRTGEVRWHIESGAFWAQPVKPGLVAVQVGGQPLDAGFVSPPTAHYIETATGREVLVLPGWPVAVPTVDPDLVLTEVPASCGLADHPADQQPDYGRERAVCTDLVAWSMSTRVERWRAPFEPAADRLYSASGDPLFAAFGQDGQLTVHSLATGAVIARRQVDDWPPVDDYGYRPVWISGGTLYAARQSGPDEDLTVTALAITVEGAAWTRSLRRHPHEQDNGGLSLNACDRWLCLFDGGGWWVLDMASGAPLFSTPADQNIDTPGFGLVAQSEQSVTGGVVTKLIDVSSGRELETVPGYLRIVSGGRAPGQPSIVLIGNPRTYDLAVLYPNGVLATIAVIEDVDICATVGTVLICTGGPDPNGRVQAQTRAWQLPAL